MRLTTSTISHGGNSITSKGAEKQAMRIAPWKPWTCHRSWWRPYGWPKQGTPFAKNYARKFAHEGQSIRGGCTRRFDPRSPRRLGAPYRLARVPPSEVSTIGASHTPDGTPLHCKDVLHSAAAFPLADCGASDALIQPAAGSIFSGKIRDHTAIRSVMIPIPFGYYVWGF